MCDRGKVAFPTLGISRKQTHNVSFVRKLRYHKKCTWRPKELKVYNWLFEFSAVRWIWKEESNVITVW